MAESSTPHDASRIPVPLSRRLNWFRRRGGPLVIWVAALFGCLVLAGRGPRVGTVAGIVQSNEATILPLRDGRVLELPVALYGDVRQGDVVAVLDDAEVRAELEVLRREGEQLRAELDRERDQSELADAQLEGDELARARRFALDLEERRLNVLDRRAQLQSKRVEQERLALFRDTLAQVAQQGGVGELRLEETELRLDVVKAEVEEGAKSLAEAERLLTTAESREASLAPPQPVMTTPERLSTALEPIRREIGVLEARTRLAELGASALVLRSPIQGKVTAILARPGELVAAGTPLARLNSSTAQTLVAYLPENAPVDVAEGAEVTVESRSTRRRASGVAVRLGNAYEPLPERLNPTPTVPRHARPVLIALSHDHGFLPGEIVTVTF